MPDNLINARGALNPFAKGLAGGQFILQRGIEIHLPGVQIDADALAGADAPLGGNILLGQLHHAGFAAHNQQPIGGDGIAHRAQPIAIHAADHPGAIGGAERCGPVPGLHHRIAIEEEVVMRRRHGGIIAERFRHQHRLGHRRITPAAHQQFEHVVEAGGVGIAGLNDRLHIGHISVERWVGEPGLMALHPVHIAMQRVDLAIMRDHPEGLRQAPGREGVGRIALVINRKARDEARIRQVRIELRQILGQEHPLVDERAAGERAEIQLRNLRRDGLLLDPPADDVKIALIGRVIAPLGVPDQNLLDLGPRRIGLFADHRGVDRHLAPAVNRVARGKNFRLANLPATLLRAKIGLGQKDHAHRDPAGLELVAAIAHRLGKEILRDFNMDARAIARLAIGIDGTAVPDGLERINTGLNDLTRGAAIEGGDEAHAAGIMLGRINMRIGQGGEVGGVVGGEFGAGFMGHRGYSAATAIAALC